MESATWSLVFATWVLVIAQILISWRMARLTNKASERTEEGIKNLQVQFYIFGFSSMKLGNPDGRIIFRERCLNMKGFPKEYITEEWIQSDLITDLQYKKLMEEHTTQK